MDNIFIPKYLIINYIHHMLEIQKIGSFALTFLSTKI